MASLATARTRLGLWGHATRPTGSFLRAPAAVVAAADVAYAVVIDVVVTLLSALDDDVTDLGAADAVVTAVGASDA